MKIFFKLFIKITIILFVIYSLYFTLNKATGDEIIILKDINNNRIIHVYTGTYNFIWQGILPWRYNIIKVPVKYASIVNILIKIPSLSALNDDAYQIKLPVNINYRINKSNIPDISYLISKADIEKYIIDKSSIICQSFLIRYLEPKYNRDEIIKNEKTIYESVKSELIKKFVNLGVIIDEIEFISTGYYPDNRLYAEGLIQNKEMRDLDFSNRKQEILLSKKLIKERYENELYYEKLLKVSSMIKDNPEILKFIYIDKLGDDIKVIISSDKTGLPAMFSDTINNAKPGVKGDVDNLR
jgi:hypothetical protein